MAGDHRARMQRLDFIERSKPLETSFLITLGEVEVGVIIDTVTRDNQIDGRDV